MAFDPSKCTTEQKAKLQATATAYHEALLDCCKTADPDFHAALMAAPVAPSAVDPTKIPGAIQQTIAAVLSILSIFGLGLGGTAV